MTRTMKRGLTTVLLILFAAWLGFVGYIGWAMRQPPETFGRVMSGMPVPAYFLFPFETMWTSARAGHVHPGDTAPSFPVRPLEGETSVSLASLWASQPVVLVFGSYT